MIALNLVSNSWRRLHRNGRNTKRRQYISGVFATTLFVMVCLHVVCHGLPPRCLSWSASTLFVMVCLHVVSHGLPPRCFSWSASTLFVMVCLHVVCHGRPPRCLSWSASTLFLMVCHHVVSHGLPTRYLSWSANTLFIMVCHQVVSHGMPRCFSWSASKLFLMVCHHIVSHGLPPRWFSWSATTLFLMVCQHVIYHGLPPSCFSWSATLFLMVCHQVVSHGLPGCFSRSASHTALGPRSLSQLCWQLFCHLEEVTVLRICILSAVHKEVLYQGGFFVGPENILRRTLGQLAEAYCLLKHAAMNAKAKSPKSRQNQSMFLNSICCTRKFSPEITEGPYISQNSSSVMCRCTHLVVSSFQHPLPSNIHSSSGC